MLTKVRKISPLGIFHITVLPHVRRQWHLLLDYHASPLCDMEDSIWVADTSFAPWFPCNDMQVHNMIQQATAIKIYADNDGYLMTIANRATPREKRGHEHGDRDPWIAGYDYYRERAPAECGHTFEIPFTVKLQDYLCTRGIPVRSGI